MQRWRMARWAPGLRALEQRAPRAAGRQRFAPGEAVEAALHRGHLAPGRLQGKATSAPVPRR